MESSRQEYRSVAIPSPGDLPDPGIKPGSDPLQADSLPSEPQGKPGFPGGSDSKVSAYTAGDPSSIPGLGRSPGEANGNPL